MSDTQKLLKDVKQLLDEFEKMIPGIHIGGHSISILFNRYPLFKEALDNVRNDLDELTKDA